MMHLILPFFAALIAAFFGFVIGLPALRLEGPYLAIATLDFGLTIMHIIGHWEVFGGRMGMTAPPSRFAIQLGAGGRCKDILPHPRYCDSSCDRREEPDDCYHRRLAGGCYHRRFWFADGS